MLKLLQKMRRREWGMAAVCVLFILGQIYFDLSLPDYMSDLTVLIKTPGSTMSDILQTGAEKLNHGDLKATQGDTGHAQIDMITSVYAHILDEDRKINAQKFESAFYANPDLRSVRPPEEPKEPAPATLDLEALVEQLRKSPELANTLAALLASAPSEK